MYLEFLLVCAVISLGGSQGEDYKQLSLVSSNVNPPVTPNLEEALHLRVYDGTDVSTQ